MGPAGGVRRWTRCGGCPPLRRRAEPAYWATVREIHRAHRGCCSAGSRSWPRSLRSPPGLRVTGGWSGGRGRGRQRCWPRRCTALPDECDVVCYFLSRREADADSSRFLAAVVPQLAYLLEEDPPAADLHQFRALWQRAAERAGAEDRHLLLVVDGLDEDLRPPGLPSVAALLPPLCRRPRSCAGEQPAHHRAARRPAGLGIRWLRRSRCR